MCFDVGANIGERTDIFLQLGARVIAIEPQPDCALYLKWKYRYDKRVTVVSAAVSAEEGESDFFVANANALSTLSREWVRRAPDGAYRQYSWDKTIRVPTITLDRLISRFGRPQFCKIDVEGAELLVCRGLSTPVSYLSLEIMPETITLLEECMKHLSFLGAVQFNFGPYEQQRFLLEHWLDREAMSAWLKKTPIQTLWGDIYARFEPAF